MLYLNINGNCITFRTSNLTLTSVVFEFKIATRKSTIICQFNFNKCCIWMLLGGLWIRHLWYLTLTSVVFELVFAPFNFVIFRFNFNKCCIWITDLVPCPYSWPQFNFNKCCIWIVPKLQLGFHLPLFNFNKCCIWIWLLFLLFQCCFGFNFNKCCIWIGHTLLIDIPLL